MARELIDNFYKKLKTRDLEALYTYIIENQLENEFLRQAIVSESTNELSLFTLKICVEKLKEKFGEQLGNRFCEIIYNGHPELKIRNLQMLIFSDLGERDCESIKALLDIFLNDNFDIGTHITGGKIGDILNEQGISLTGHKFSPAAKIQNESVKGALELNVSFFPDPVSFIYRLSSARGYNVRTPTEHNDIMLVAIPREKMQQTRGDNNGVIIQNNGEEFLNPEYVLGFVREDIKTGEIEGIHINDKFKAKEEFQEKANDEKWEERFEEWYRDASTPRYCKAMRNVMNFLGNIFQKMVRENYMDR